jgi:hypothetical protein
LSPFRPFKTKVPWALVFVAKIFVSVAIIDAAVFPILWSLKAALLQAYIVITCFEGLCIILIGGLLLFTSLFSTIEQANHRYVGLGAYRYGLRSKKLKKEQKHAMRLRGILMIMVGILLSVPSLMVILKL